MNKAERFPPDDVSKMDKVPVDFNVDETGTESEDVLYDRYEIRKEAEADIELLSVKGQKQTALHQQIDDINIAVRDGKMKTDAADERVEALEKQIYKLEGEAEKPKVEADSDTGVFRAQIEEINADVLAGKMKPEVADEKVGALEKRIHINEWETRKPEVDAEIKNLEEQLKTPVEESGDNTLSKNDTERVRGKLDKLNNDGPNPVVRKESYAHSKSNKKSKRSKGLFSWFGSVVSSTFGSGTKGPEK